MSWDAKTNTLDLDDPPPILAKGRRNLGTATVGQRIPWRLLGGLLNRVLSGRLDARLVRALLSLGPEPVAEAAEPFEAALGALAGAGAGGGTTLGEDEIAEAIETVEERLFSLPLNLAIGPGQRADDPATPWVPGGASPRPSEAMDVLPEDVDATGVCRPSGLGRAQAARESLMCALNALDLLSTVPDVAAADIAAALDRVESACSRMAGAWTGDAGLGLDALAPADPTNFVPEPGHAGLWQVPGCRRWEEHVPHARTGVSDPAALAARVAASVALSRTVQQRALVCDLPVFRDSGPAPDAAAAAPPAAAEPPRPPARSATPYRGSPRARRHSIRHFGWVPDLLDIRDKVAVPHAVIGNLPPSADLRPGCPPVYAQGEIGSCTANAIAAAIQFARMRAGLGTSFMPSRLFIYYNEREMENTVATDSGAQIRDGLKSVSTTGVCPESDWPYDAARLFEQPPETLYAEAGQIKLSAYLAIEQDLAHLRACLAAGNPFVFGFSAYTSLESDAVAASGTLDLPDQRTEQMLGGHAVMAVGYQDGGDGAGGGRFIVRNSWGDGWGQGGYFTMPYAYLADPSLATNFWRIELPTDAPAADVAAVPRLSRKPRGRAPTAG